MDVVQKSDIHEKPFVEENDFVVLFFSHNNIISAKMTKNGTHKTRYGTYRFSDIIGKPFGAQIHPFDTTSSEGGYVLRPSPELVTQTLTRLVQILYHADIMTVIQLLGLAPGKVVIEAGTGSGSLTTSLARAVGDTGEVHTCEFHYERHLKAKEEFINYGINHIVRAYHRDVIANGVPEVEGNLTGRADGVFLDLPAPWAVVPSAYRALKCGGKVVCFSPCIEQVAKNCQALEDLKFNDIMTIEVISKPWHTRFKVRKGTEEEDLPAVDEVMSVALPMRGHTGYLTVAVKSPDAELKQKTKEAEDAKAAAEEAAKEVVQAAAAEPAQEEGDAKME